MGQTRWLKSGTDSTFHKSDKVGKAFAELGYLFNISSTSYHAMTGHNLLGVISDKYW